jgi:CRISPR system Cascade subunit CasE
MSDLWLTRATLKTGSADVRPLLDALLRDTCAGRHLDTTHRLLWTLMPEALQGAGKPRGADGDKSAFLWRRSPEEGGAPTWYVLGPEPRSDCAFFHVESKPWAPVLVAGDRLSFDLVVNATVARMVEPARGRAGRMRVDVVMDAVTARERAGAREPRAELRRVEGARAMRSWMDAQAARNGFRLLDPPDLLDYRNVSLNRRGAGGRGAAQLGISRLTGQIEVSDPEAVLARVAKGFGRAKAFGCGLMLIRRAAGERAG